jgi:hypothetical protein
MFAIGGAALQGLRRNEPSPAAGNISGRMSSASGMPRANNV